MSSINFEKYTIDIRLRLLVTSLTNGKSNWKWLEESTGIAAEKWRQFHSGKTKASVEMVESIGREWPEYAFWLTTGISEPSLGHLSPRKWLNFPKEGYIEDDESTVAAKHFFKECAKAVQLQWKQIIEDELAQNSELEWKEIEKSYMNGMFRHPLSQIWFAMKFLDKRSGEKYVRNFESLYKLRRVELQNNRYLIEDPEFRSEESKNN